MSNCLAYFNHFNYSEEGLIPYIEIIARKKCYSITFTCKAVLNYKFCSKDHSTCYWSCISQQSKEIQYEEH